VNGRVRRGSVEGELASATRPDFVPGVTFMIVKDAEKQAKADIRAIRAAGKKINASPETARAFFMKHGFLTKDGKRLHPRYGG
jgi:hypothetical protein